MIDEKILTERLEEKRSKYQDLANGSNFDGWHEEDIKYTSKAEMCEEIVEIVNQLAEEQQSFGNSEQVNNVWIPCSSGVIPKEGQRVWLSFTNEVTSYVKDAWWQGKFFVWNNCHIVKDTPMAWKPYEIPAPYKPKG